MSAAIGGAVGGAIVGTTGNLGAAGAASAATSTLTEGVWDMIDGTKDFDVENVSTLVIKTGVNAGIGYGLGKVTGKLGEKVISKSSTLKKWDFKYNYANKRIKNGSWTIIDTLKIHGGKFVALEAAGALPGVGVDTLNVMSNNFISDISDKIDTQEVIDFIRKYIDELLQFVSEQELLKARCSA